jgi:hypothetical protein
MLSPGLWLILGMTLSAGLAFLSLRLVPASYRHEFVTTFLFAFMLFASQLAALCSR